mmetsp:Transcript_12943/g.21695  ORF Transcript_12943/g.21695 Transcript_12943/m.21695 type:complete len:247 (+) Transcript_12943:207-947(+)
MADVYGALENEKQRASSTSGLKEMTDDEVDKALENPTNGVFVLMGIAWMTADYSSFYATLVVILVQIFLYVGLVMGSAVDGFDLCPAEVESEADSWAIRLVFVGICLLYSTRLVVGAKNLMAKDEADGGSTSEPDYMQCCDILSDTVYNNAVYLFNLLVVCTSDNVLDMVLNSLAMEFLGSLDNEVKEVLLGSGFKDTFKKSFETFHHKAKVPEWVSCVVGLGAFGVAVLSPFFYVGAAIHGTFCS